MKRRLVPYRRQIKLGTRGRDVIALKRALSRAGLLAWKGKLFTPLMGPLAVNALKKFQKRVKLTPDGAYGPRTHAALARHRWKGVQAYDAYSAYLMGSAKILTAAQQREVKQKQKALTVRQGVVAAAWLGYNNRDRISYTQGPSRMYGITARIFPPRVPWTADCSAFTTWAYRVAGGPDPNGAITGRWWSGYGYTGTQLVQGRRVQVPDLGDLVFYGPGTGRHVAIYIGGGRAIGHGSSSGPSLTSVYYRRDFREFRSYLDS